MIDLKDIETKLSAARTRLILEKPFIGSLVMHLPLVAAEGNWCETTATDAKAFYYNPFYIESLNLGETQFVLAHEAMHCALSHFARRSHRIKHRWDVACDHAVNHLLVAEGFKAPPGVLLNPLYKDLTAEEIYPFIKNGTSEKTLDHHIFDGDQGDDQGLGEGDVEEESSGGNRDEQRDDREGKKGNEAGDSGAGKDSKAPDQGEGESDEGNIEMEHRTQREKPQDLGETEREELATQWRQRLASAAQQARQAGKLGESWMRTVDELLQPKLPWRMMLARYMMSISRDDYSFQRSSRREGEALLPSLYSGQVDVLAVIDTSGSIDREEMQEFVTEVDALKGQIRARVVLHACDERLSENGPWVYEAWEPMDLPDKMAGGGGTRFAPVFEWVEREGLQPNIVLYFTDAEGEFPDKEPPFPVIWLVKGKAPVPWGERIQLNN